MAKVIAEYKPEDRHFRVVCREEGCYLRPELKTRESAMALAIGHFDLKNHHVVVEDTREA